MTTLEHLNFGWLHAPPLPAACCHCLLLRQDDRVALIDTGIGMHDIADPEGRIGAEAIRGAGFQFIPSVTAVAQLQLRGIHAAAVSDIVLTHCDPDHAGGLADFPEAVVHVSFEERVALDAADPRYSPAQFAHGVKWRTYATDDADFFGLAARRVATVFDAEILLVPLFGHTAGHCGVAVRSQEHWTLHVGDAYYLRDELGNPQHPVDQLAAFRAHDDSLRRASLERIRVLLRRDGSNVTICGYHDTSELPVSVPPLH
jgi:glyoxylase-like metal-dependent hydrolase (beta-lactamase superfamily II)